MIIGERCNFHLLGLGMFVSINQRLDAEAITVIADEFGYDVQFSFYRGGGKQPGGTGAGRKI